MLIKLTSKLYANFRWSCLESTVESLVVVSRRKLFYICYLQEEKLEPSSSKNTLLIRMYSIKRKLYNKIISWL